MSGGCNYGSKQAVGGPTVTSGRMSSDHNILSFDAVGGLADCTFFHSDYETAFFVCSRARQLPPMIVRIGGRYVCSPPSSTLLLTPSAVPNTGKHTYSFTLHISHWAYSFTYCIFLMFRITQCFMHILHIPHIILHICFWQELHI